jgi:hypothetical protein
MNAIIQKLIEDNINNIEAENFDIVYDRAMSMNLKINMGELTDIFYDAGIDPLASLTEIPSLFLDESKITALVVPENIKRIRKAGLAFSKLEHVELHKDCELSESCFLISELKSVIIPYIMNEVPDECFYRCQELTDVDLNAVEQIGAEAFAYCTSLKNIFIPDDINYIANTAFEGCDITLYFHNNNEYAIEYCQRNNMRYKFV